MATGTDPETSDKSPVYMQADATMCSGSPSPEKRKTQNSVKFCPNMMIPKQFTVRHNVML